MHTVGKEHSTATGTEMWRAKQYERMQVLTDANHRSLLASENMFLLFLKGHLPCEASSDSPTDLPLSSPHVHEGSLGQVWALAPTLPRVVSDSS